MRQSYPLSHMELGYFKKLDLHIRNVTAANMETEGLVTFARTNCYYVTYYHNA